MSTFDLNISASGLQHPFDTQSQSPFSRFQQAFSLRFAEWKHRRTLVKLLDLEDAILEDMGTRRADLFAALELPLSQSASKALAQWHAERKVTG
ncbi:hypothetical protein ACQUQP_04155 [Marinobacterium sp. YM272]|uniref:hypothetical protein n=1 Tax=Marinobacterium sp. YM272 TaxID=3421654 RepID=UPI003D7F3B95